MGAGVVGSGRCRRSCDARRAMAVFETWVERPRECMLERSVARARVVMVDERERKDIRLAVGQPQWPGGRFNRTCSVLHHRDHRVASTSLDTLTLLTPYGSEKTRSAIRKTAKSQMNGRFAFAVRLLGLGLRPR